MPRVHPVAGCPVCGQPGATHLFSSPDRMHGVPGTYAYRRCPACRTVYQDPRVSDEDVALLYPIAYYTHADGAREGATGPGSATGRDVVRGWRASVREGVRRAQAPGAADGPSPPWHRLLARSRWIRERAFYDLVQDEMLPWRTPAGRALDVGCGSGELMLRLAALGWEVQGAEPDPAAAEVARRRTGAEVWAAGVAGLRREDMGAFDLLTLSHVLEHLPSPREALRSLARLLKPGGRLVALWPNPDSLGARVFRESWFAWDAPRHLVLPSPSAIRALVEGTGLDVRRARTLWRWGADHAMQSAAYRRGEGLQSGVPGGWQRGFGGVGRALVGLGLDVGEEVLVQLETVA